MKTWIIAILNCPSVRPSVCPSVFSPEPHIFYHRLALFLCSLSPSVYSPQPKISFHKFLFSFHVPVRPYVRPYSIHTSIYTHILAYFFKSPPPHIHRVPRKGLISADYEQRDRSIEYIVWQSSDPNPFQSTHFAIISFLFCFHVPWVRRTWPRGRCGSCRLSQTINDLKYNFFLGEPSEKSFLACPLKALSPPSLGLTFNKHNHVFLWLWWKLKRVEYATGRPAKKVQISWMWNYINHLSIPLFTISWFEPFSRHTSYLNLNKSLIADVANNDCVPICNKWNIIRRFYCYFVRQKETNINL